MHDSKYVSERSRPVELVISGGYNASYSTKSGLSVVTGAVKIRDGKVIADGLAIRP